MTGSLTIDDLQHRLVRAEHEVRRRTAIRHVSVAES